MILIKGHAYGNDFLLVRRADLAPGADAGTLARAVCARHRGLGADGLMIVGEDEGRTSMRLLNADGSPSEISGNGLRCLAAWLAARAGLGIGATVAVETGAGVKTLELLERDGPRYRFRAAMGLPEAIAEADLEAGGERVRAITLRVGNPQCVVLGPATDLTEERLHRVAAALAVHPHFPEGTNVELATVEAPGRVRILIWERGVGPTEASGTGACGAAVAASRFGGAGRVIDVISPGGTQRVEWQDDGVYLTGWAELVAEATWLKD